MAEQLVNEFTVNRPIEEAWPVICDLERIAPCLPGAQLEEIEGDEYRGVVKVKLGAVSTQFKGAAHFVERDDDAHRAVLKAEGRDTGGRGNAAADITATAQALSPTSTHVEVIADLHITGKVAQFGRGILGDVSKKLMAQFADNLNTMLDEGPVGPSSDSGDTAPADATTSDAAESASVDTAAVDPATGDTATGDTAIATAATSGSAGNAPSAVGTAPASTAPTPTTPTSTTPTSTTPTSTAPTVRKIEGPATEPIDMAGMAGPALLKRLGPALLGLVILFLLVRRRRD